MKILGFVRSNNKWYVTYNSDTIEERRMICGADTLLDIINSTGSVYQTVKLYPTRNVEDTLSLAKDSGWSAMFKQHDIPSGGATYACPSYKGEQINHHLWLGETIKKALGDLPEVILFKK